MSNPHPRTDSNNPGLAVSYSTSLENQDTYRISLGDFACGHYNELARTSCSGHTQDAAGKASRNSNSP
jgi:hypothetical protein